MKTCYAVPICEAWLVYAPLRVFSALVNEAALRAAFSGKACPPDSELAPLQQALAEEEIAPACPRAGAIEPDFLGLVPTRCCNLACPYCDFGPRQQPASFMDLRLAVSAVDWLAQQLVAARRTTLELHFFGGEPLVALEVVETAVHRARAQAAQHHLQTRFEVTTNGVLNERSRAFLADYFDAVVLSFDGPPEIQDHHRPTRGGKSTFKAVSETARALARSPVELCFRSCITQATVGQMAQITDWFLKNFSPSSLCFEPLKPSPASAAAGLCPPDPYDFARNFWAAQKRAQADGVRVIYAASEPDKPRLTFCPVGRDTVIVTPDGTISACYLPQASWGGLDLTFGKFLSTGAAQVDMDALNRIRGLVELPARCQSCFARWQCAGGCHVCQSPPGCKDGFNDYCIRTRLVLALQLLRELGCDDVAERLIGDRAALERLAYYQSDDSGLLLS